MRILNLLPFVLFLHIPNLQAQVYPNAKTGGNYMHNYYLPPAGSSTPWWPSWSPDGQWIAFAMDGSIWKARVGDSTAYEVIYAKEYLSSPEWSPDGKWIAYTADDDSKSINLMLFNVETGKSTALTTGSFENLEPAWSPDGKRLAYVSTEPNGWFNIFVMNISNGEKGKVTPITTDHKFGRARLYFSDNDIHISPTWSPDGKELIFISDRDIPLGSGGIWRAPVEANVMNSGKAKLIHKEETLYRTRPQWSPDGKRIVYSSYLGGQYNNLFVLPASGGEPYKMTFGEYDSFLPRWSPDGEWIAYISNEAGLPQLKLLKSWGGEQKLVKISSRRWSRPMGTVTVRVVDGETGKETEARIYQKASDGKVYTPGDSYERFGPLNEHLFHTPGHFSVEVPPGVFTVEAVKGFEYDAARQTVQVKAGEVQNVTLTLKRMTNLKAKGWYSGSNHVHMNYAGNLHNTPENIFMMNAAEDADFISLLIANKDNRVLDYQYYVPGQALHPLSTKDRIMHIAEEYRPPFWGHISLLNLKDHLISPWVTGYEGTALESLYPSNTDIFRYARQQGAIGAYVHPFSGDGDPLAANLGTAKGFPVDVALEAVSYHEIWSQSAGDAALNVWYHALNNGFKLPIAGGEDSISNLHRVELVASVRSYFYLGLGNLSWDNVMDALLKGRSFVTNGPLIEFSAGQSMPGDEIQLPASGGKVRFHAVLNSIAPIDRFELVMNGKVVDSLPLTGDRRHGTFDKEITVSESGWYSMRAIGNSRTHPVENTRPQAVTNPIYAYVGGRQIRNKASADYFVRWIDKLKTMVEAHPGWRSDREKQHVLDQIAEARAIYVKRGSEAR
jgi:Tol biopolymer transport system component